MKPENRQEVVSALKHFEKDLREYGIFLQDIHPDEEHRYCRRCKFGEWPKPQPFNEKPYARGPQADVVFGHTEDYGYYNEWGERNCKGVLFDVEQSLTKEYNGKSLIIGAALLSIIENWGFNHGRFMHRSDNQGIYWGDHVKYIADGIVRPHGAVSKHFLIHQEVYRNENK